MAGRTVDRRFPTYVLASSLGTHSIRASVIFAREREREEGMNHPPTKSFLVIGYHQAVFCDAIFLFKN